MGKPRIALIVTTYFEHSHADVIAGRLLDGYFWDGRHCASRVEVVSMYLEQLGAIGDDGAKRPDIGISISDRHGVPRFPTVAEAIGCGQGGVAVDGVVIIGEHGDYGYSAIGQKLYPRRRLFDDAVATMISAGRFVPVFNDKHLAWSFTDALAMYQTALRLGIPFLAGSSLPLTWRVPVGAQWPLGAEMTDLVVVGHGPKEIYDFHSLETMQVHAERRAGGETGVASVQGLSGPAAARAMNDGSVNSDLFGRALDALHLDEASYKRAGDEPQNVFIINYTDGLRAAVVNCEGSLKGFAAAAAGPRAELACHMWLEKKPRFGHFTFLVRQLEALFLANRAPYPVERTLLTTGLLEVALRSVHQDGTPQETPELSLAYSAPGEIADTGLHLPVPDEPESEPVT